MPAAIVQDFLEGSFSLHLGKYSLEALGTLCDLLPPWASCESSVE